MSLVIVFVKTPHNPYIVFKNYIKTQTNQNKTFFKHQKLT